VDKKQISPAKTYVINEYSHLAPFYDRRWSFYNKATLKETLQRLNLRGKERVLDIGCGTGSLLQAISSQYSQIKVIGADICWEMLNVAQKKYPSHYL
jgi:ubiquinone/menaquinone biosynthesis C-methylase UbiE